MIWLQTLVSAATAAEQSQQRCPGSCAYTLTAASVASTSVAVPSLGIASLRVLYLRCAWVCRWVSGRAGLQVGLRAAGQAAGERAGGQAGMFSAECCWWVFAALWFCWLWGCQKLKLTAVASIRRVSRCPATEPRLEV